MFLRLLVPLSIGVLAFGSAAPALAQTAHDATMRHAMLNMSVAEKVRGPLSCAQHMPACALAHHVPTAYFPPNQTSVAPPENATPPEKFFMWGGHRPSPPSSNRIRAPNDKK